MEQSLTRRATAYAALGDPTRLAIVDELATSDRSPSELTHRFDLAPSLLAHHLDVLEVAGLIERSTSAADRRRRYIRLLPGALPGASHHPVRARSALFVCSHNSARSQLAAALWTHRTGRRAVSAGTHPAQRVHPGAVAAARRAGLDISGAIPRPLDGAPDADLVVTVCDQAHEEIATDPTWMHWSVPDPVAIGSDAAFDAALHDIAGRINRLTGVPT